MLMFWNVKGASEPIRVGMRPPWIENRSLIANLP